PSAHPVRRLAGHDLEVLPVPSGARARDLGGAGRRPAVVGLDRHPAVDDHLLRARPRAVPPGRGASLPLRRADSIAMRETQTRAAGRTGGIGRPLVLPFLRVGMVALATLATIGVLAALGQPATLG